MKDIFGQEIKLGDFVIYMSSITDKIFEKAIVTSVEDSFIRIEYSGDHNSESIASYRLNRVKQRGKKSRLTVTNKKIIVINSEQDVSKYMYVNEIDRLKKEIEKTNRKMKKVIDEKNDLISKNEELKKETEKIHYRSDILDL